MGRPRFRLLETTADVGLLVWGETEADLFRNAAAGLFRVIASPRGVRPVEERIIEAEGRDSESRLVAWLSEWLFLFDTEGFIGASFAVHARKGNNVRGRGRGELYDPSRHLLRAEVKGITYHGLEITRPKGRYRARLVLDV